MNKVREAVKEAMTRSKTAAFPPFSKNGPPPPPLEGGGGSKRNIPNDHSFDPKALKPMSRALWASSMALGHALAAYREFSRLKSASVSPDGMLGGRGYVMNVRDIRQKLFEATESLSAISDTLFDEINAPHWKPKLALLDQNDKEDVGRFVEESADVLKSPEDEASEEMAEIEEANDKKPSKSEPEAPLASKMPGGGASELSVAKPAGPDPKLKQASIVRTVTAEEVEALTDRIFQAIESGNEPTPVVRVFLEERLGNSSLPVNSLPGPRVDHLDPAEGMGPWGSFNDLEKKVDRADDSDDEYDYTSEWENDLRREATSGLPQDSTPTEAWDFGIGYGARGQGAGDYRNPSNEGDGKGVWGPQSGLPGTTPQSPGDSATAPAVDQALNERHGQGVLPQDVAGPPARSDYFRGPTDNQVQGEAGLPGDQTAPWDQDLHIDVDTGYVYEDLTTPYVRNDYTRNERPKRDLHDTAPWSSNGEGP